MTPEHRQEPYYVTRHEMARIMGVSVRTIDQFVTEGCPSVSWGIRARRFLPTAVIAWARLRETPRMPAQKKAA